MLPLCVSTKPVNLASFGVASILGPLVGGKELAPVSNLVLIFALLSGAFSDHVSWRWCFYINLVGILSLIFQAVSVVN